MISADTFVETAAQTIAIPGDLPAWVTPELIAEAAATLPPTDSVTQGPNGALVLIDTPYGPVYAAPGAPEWVTENAIAQAKAAFESNTPTPAPPPPTPVMPSPTGVVAVIAGTARAVLDRVGGLIKPAATAVRDVATGVMDSAKAILDRLLPTIQELAIGLTSRFADLASNIASKTIDFGTYSYQLAIDAANAMGAVLDEAWSWILKALVGFLNVLLAPLTSLYKSLTSNLLEPAL